MLENLVEYYRKSDGKTKMKILSCIFSKKIVLEKSRVATCEFTPPINVLINACKVLKSSGTKKEVENDLLSCLAPQVVPIAFGIEPKIYKYFILNLSVISGNAFKSNKYFLLFIFLM